MGARILGLPGMVGVELDEDACATARAAGFVRVQHDIRDVAPARHRGVIGAAITPPCPGFSDGGLRLGRGDMQEILDAITCFGMGCGCDWNELPHRTADPRSQLVLEAARWILTAPDLEWFVCEQVPAVAPIWEDITAEAYSAGWEWVDVCTISATDFGLPSKRVRTFVYGRRYGPSRVTVHDAGWNGAELPRHTMASVLDLPAGTRVNTRGERKTSGGNYFSADGPSWCLTGSTRSWKLATPDGRVRELTPAEAGLLNGFPVDYPWQGSRSKQFLQIADVVNPVIAAVVLGVATNTPWVGPVRDYLGSLYATDLFDLLAYQAVAA
jgi:DNA (cytosine-5)-methyltransferase 1